MLENLVQKYEKICKKFTWIYRIIKIEVEFFKIKFETLYYKYNK